MDEWSIGQMGIAWMDGRMTIGRWINGWINGWMKARGPLDEWV